MTNVAGQARPISARWRQDGSATLLARLAEMPTSPTVGATGTPLTIADVSAIQYTAYSDGAAVDGHDAADLDPADVMLDELAGWPEDDVGYNFRHTLGPSAFPAGSVLGVIRYKFTLASGYVVFLEFRGPVEPTE